MKSLMLLWQVTAKELGGWCCTSTTRDYQTVSSRVKYEGMSFLTICLPNFGKDFEKSLDQGFVDRDHFQGFPFSGGLPRFLGGFLDLVFDRGTGLLLPNPNMDAIFSIRQLTLMMGKLETMCSDTRVSNAMKGFVEVEKELRGCDTSRTDAENASFRQVAHLLWDKVLSGVDSDIDHHRLVPKHGPGATADRLKGNQKYCQTEWTWRLEKIFSSTDFLLPNPRHYHSLDRVSFLDPGMERPVRVTPVPKTMKTPRLIAIEPTCMQYTQQALKESLVNRIEHDDIMSTFVGFEFQEPNRFLARNGSLTGKLATLDLSEASDRVSNQLVREMVKYHPSFAKGIDACRSRKADVDGFGVLRLTKFASMGSALTFPIEAMVFATVVFLGIQQSLKRPLTLNDIKSLRGQVRIYGDDIIVPVDHVRSVLHCLNLFGFKVNMQKSFWTGKYRESCGGDYFNGIDVTVVRVRRNIPSKRKSALEKKELIATVSLRNRLFERGMYDTASYIDGLIERVIPFPLVLATSPILGKVGFLGYSTERTHPTLHHPLVRGIVVSSTIPKSFLSDIGALQKHFLKRGDLPFVDRKHLERFGRPVAVNTKLRWASPF